MRIRTLGLMAIVCVVGVQPAAAPSSAVARKPLRFEANAGQWDSRIQFRAVGSGASLFVTDEGLESAGVTLKLSGARPAVAVGEEPLVTKSNFILGNDPAAWRTNVPNYARVRAKDVVRGVDVVWHGGGESLEYDLEVAAGVDASKLVFEIDGARAVERASDGGLEIATDAGTLLEHAPRVYQDGRELDARYVLADASHVGFAIDDYDAQRPVLIDPELFYSTYLGGSSGAGGSSIAVDSSGNAYVTGGTSDTDFPTKSPMQAAKKSQWGTAFVSKIDATDNLVYSTYLGGTTDDWGSAIAVDSSGNAYVAGGTSSTDFPTQSPLQAANAGTQDVFVAVLNASGSGLVYSTYLGGTSFDYATAIALDASANVYVAGDTRSSNFPTQSAYQPTNHGSTEAFVFKLNASGSALLYSTYLGGSGDESAAGVAVDTTGDAYVTGTTKSGNFPTFNAFEPNAVGEWTKFAFVTKFGASGSSVVYSTYLGAGNDSGSAVAVDSAGSAYVTGVTNQPSFPVQNALYPTINGPFHDEGFLTKFSASGTSLVYSTFFGGSADERGNAVGLDTSGDAYVTGYTSATDFPTQNPLQATNAGGNDAFVFEMNAAGSALVYSTYLGGSTGDDSASAIAVDSAGTAYVTGTTGSTDFPTVSPFQAINSSANGTAFVAKIGNANPNLPNGMPCVPGACASGLCVDGYCCDSLCTDECAACDNPGMLGTCSLVHGPPHGKRTPCADGGAEGCGLTCGVTSDTTKCAYPTNATQCAATCKNAVETDTFCNGAGLCDIVVAHGCEDFACMADAGTCRTTCAADLDCVNGFGCVDGGCVVTTKCVDQRTAQPANGPSIDCAPYKCVNGCTTTCQTDNDCTSPATCRGGQCVPPAPPPTGGCNCDLARMRSGFPWGVALAFGVLVGARRRNNPKQARLKQKAS